MSIDIFDNKRQFADMKDLKVDPKRQMILDAAWQAFSSYGFRKTSMDDIAKGAGMSRPALYLQYRNKEDIFRSLVQYYYDSTIEDVRAALDQPGTPREVLKSAFHVQTGEIMQATLTSPHGHELMDTGAATAADIKEAGEAALRTLYAEWLARQVQAGQIHLTGAPEEIAAAMCASLKGLKEAGGDFATFSARVDVLADLFGAGLAAD